MFLPLLATFFEFNATDTLSLLGYIKSFLGDLSPILIIIVSISAGLLIFWGITQSIKH